MNRLIATKIRQIKMSASLILLLLFLFATAQVLFRGYEFAVNDHAIEIPFIKKNMDGGLYPDDPMVDTRGKFVTFYTWIPAILTMMTNNMEIVFFALQMLAFFLVAVMIYYLGLQLSNDRVSALMALILIFPKKFVLGGSSIHITSFVPSFSILPIALLAIYLFLDNRYVFAYVIIGLSFNYHALVSLYVFGMFTLYSVVHVRQIGIKRLGKSIGLCLLCASPVIIWMLAVSSPMPEGWIKLMRIRSSHHSFPLSWKTPLYIDYLLFIALASLSLLTPPEKRYHSKILFFGAAIALMCGMGLVFAEILPIKFVIKAQLFRSTNFLTLFMLIYLANYFRRSWSDSSIHKFAIVASVLILFFKASYFNYILLVLILFLIAELNARRQTALSWKPIAIAVFITSVLLLRVFAPHSSFPKTFSFDPITDFINKFLENQWTVMAICSAILLYVLGYLIKPGFKKIRGIGIALVTVSIFAVMLPGVFRHFHPSGRNKSSWREAQFWAKNNTQKSDTFITPPYMTGFRIFSERPIVGENKDGTQQYFDSEYGTLWWERMNDLGMGKEFDKLDQEGLARIANKYGAKYIVVPASKELNLRIAHQNSGYKIYQYDSE